MNAGRSWALLPDTVDNTTSCRLDGKGPTTCPSAFGKQKAADKRASWVALAAKRAAKERNEIITIHPQRTG